MVININLDLERFRYALVGNGFILNEVEKLSEEELIAILQAKITSNVNEEYYRGKRIGLYE